MPVDGLLNSDTTLLRRFVYAGKLVESERASRGSVGACVAIPVRHCQASDGLRGTEPMEVSSSSTDACAGAGGFGGRKTTGPG
jgi:hypothetical protein